MKRKLIKVNTSQTFSSLKECEFSQNKNKKEKDEFKNTLKDQEQKMKNE